MKNNKILRTLAVAIILALLLVALPSTPVLAARAIELDPASGKIGDEITVTGTGFPASTETWVRVYFAEDEASTVDDIDVEVKTYKRVTSKQVDDAGEFEATFLVPAELTDGTADDNVEPGTYYVYVTIIYAAPTGELPSIKAVAEFTVIGGEITIDLDEGPVGTEVEISGQDFGKSQDITIEYDGDEVDIESGDDETDSSGNFDATIIIPESIAGDHTITVTAGTGSETEATFTVEPQITVAPTSGGAGTAVTVNGTGFGYKSDVITYFNNVEMTLTSETATTDKYGSFENLKFNVPTAGPGTYKIKAEDEDDNSATANFAIAAGASLSSTTGNVGTKLTVSGTGFVAGGTVTIRYDTTQVATATTGANGAFSATFTVPKSKHGEHTITASDSANTKQFTFTMESTAPSTPAPLKPEMGIKVESPVLFDWGDVTDTSGVTYTLQIASDAAFTTMVLNKAGLTQSEYTLTEAEKLPAVKKEAPYYWRVKAIDDASNESGWSGAGSFYTGSSFGLSQQIIYVLFGIGALLFGVLGFWLGKKSSYY